MKNLARKSLLLFACALIFETAFAEEDPCAGLLSVVNRPSQSDSVCPVSPDHLLLESGINYFSLGAKHAFSFPVALLRLGLPKENEVYALLPNYISQNYSPHRGFTATQIGVKHRLFATDKWVAAVEGAVTLPTGSYNFGSHGTGATVNGLLEYEFNSAWTVLMMLSLNSITMPSYQGGQRYTTLNPFLLVGDQFNDRTEVYVEIFGQSRTAAGQGAGFDMDAGILYLLRKNWEVDAEFGHRISGIPIGFNSYVGVGTSYLFG